MPTIHIIAGPNGAGKTTSAMKLLPDVLECSEYVNADSIAHGISPFHQEAVSIQAGRLMLKRIKHLIEKKENLAFETTLASRSFLPLIKNCIDNTGYTVNLIYLWLVSPQLALQRVADRVQRGGHNIPSHDVIRRYHRSIKNFMSLYRDVVHGWTLYDNSHDFPEVVSYRRHNLEMEIANLQSWNIFKGYADE